MSDIVKLLEKSELTNKEIELLLKTKKKGARKTKRFNLGSGSIRFGVVSDQHYGSSYSSQAAHDASVYIFNKKQVDAILCPGDFIEGMSNREGHVYELEDIGVSAQLSTAISRLKEYGGLPMYGITGNHDEWSKKKSDQGFDVGPYLEDHVDNFEFLGEYEGEVWLNNNVRVQLTHRGSSAYALSYSLQKRINALEGGTKPQVLLNGHIHKAIYMPYRNISSMECGTLQRQTPFMAMKGSPAMVGFWTIDITFNKEEVTSFSPTWYPIYDED